MFPPFPLGPRLGFPSNPQPPTPTLREASIKAQGAGPESFRIGKKRINDSTRLFRFIGRKSEVRTPFFWGEGDTHPLLVVAGFNQPIEEKYAHLKLDHFPQGKGKI